MPWHELAHAWGSNRCHALFRASPEDFRVDEILGFEPTGDGEHVLCQLEKTGLTTTELAAHLSSRLGIPRTRVAWSGMKDRQGVTTQWFSLQMKAMPEPAAIETPSVKLLRAERNHRKLRIGSHRGNAFRIHLRQVSGDLNALADTFSQICRHGVPNYFGYQRFGSRGDNVEQAIRLFSGDRTLAGRQTRSILLSAARSHLFNEVLSRRVHSDTWKRVLPGDVLALEGSRSVFTPDWPALMPDELSVLEQRMEEGDIHPTGPLWGRGSSPATSEAAVYEDPETLPAVLRHGLEQAGLQQERRPLRLMLQDGACEPAGGGGLMIEFRLGRGGYATSVLRELIHLQAGTLDTGNR